LKNTLQIEFPYSIDGTSPGTVLSIFNDNSGFGFIILVYIYKKYWRDTTWNVCRCSLLNAMLEGMPDKFMKTLPLRPVTIAAVLCLAWFLVAFIGTGYAIDDTYIHLTYARNLADGYGLSFSSSDGPLYSCTSPAWAAILAVAYKLDAGGLAAARLLSCMAGALTIFLLYMLSRSMLSRGAAVFPPIMLALNPWWIRWSCSGMETALAALLVTACLLLHVRGREKTALILSGLGIIIRPELAVLGPILLLTGKRKEWLRCLSYSPYWLTPTLAWIILAWFHFGSPVPASALSKVSDLPLFSYLVSSLIRTGEVLITSDAVPTALLILLAAGAAVRKWSIPRPGRQWLPCLLLPPAILAVIVAGRGPVVSRYLLPAWPLLLLVEVKGMQLIAARIGKRTRNLWKILAVTSILVETLVLVTVFIPHMINMNHNLNVYRNAALYMRDSLPDNAVVAVREVGVFGYLSEKELIDLEGLVTPEVTPSSFPGLDVDLLQSLNLLRQLGVTHIMDPNDTVRLLEGLSQRSGVNAVLLKDWSFTGGTSLGGSDYVRELYRLDWSEGVI